MASDPMSPVTLFSFGYFGWGNCTPKLVELVDAVEQGRGFGPPTFVDIRIRRSVRAAGFNGTAFEKLLGAEHHRWMPSLGNRHILTRKGPFIQIAEPDSANDLLDLALHLAGRDRRLLFFCGCVWPREAGEVACHRCTVTGLLIEAARRRNWELTVVEWPGGVPEVIDLDPPHARAAKGRKAVPLGKDIDLARLGGLPWASQARGEGEDLLLLGPVKWQKGGWALPVLGECDGRSAAARATSLRRDFGLEPLSA
jgi:hypothetical protein